MRDEKAMRTPQHFRKLGYQPTQGADQPGTPPSGGSSVSSVAQALLRLAKELTARGDISKKPAKPIKPLEVPWKATGKTITTENYGSSIAEAASTEAAKRIVKDHNKTV